MFFSFNELRLFYTEKERQKDRGTGRETERRTLRQIDKHAHSQIILKKIQ